MLLDQQFPMERAFFGPELLRRRLGGQLDAAAIADYDPDRLVEIFKGPPAIHRFPGSFASRTQQLCRLIADDYGGEADRLWSTAASGEDLYQRLRRLPGYGEAKARIFVGILGKRLGVRPPGWAERAADWLSIADVASWDDVAVVREKKRALKAKS